MKKIYLPPSKSFFIIFYLLLTLFATASHAFHGDGKIAGTVVDNSGHAIGGVSINVTRYFPNQPDNYPTENHRIRTNPDGTFEDANLSPGDYELFFSPYVYIEEYYDNATDAEDATRITITSNENITGLIIVLSKYKSITGIVKDSTGEVLSNIAVRAYQANDGNWSSVSENDFIAEVKTDKNGFYSFNDFLNGTYRIGFNFTQASSTRGGKQRKRFLQSLSDNGIEYYKDASSLMEAMDIVIDDIETPVVINDVIMGAPDDPVDISVEVTDATASEVDGSTGLFLISRTGGIDDELVVSYNLSGTAVNGVDYDEIGDSVTILAGESSATIEIIPKQDNDVTEGDETVVITLIDSEEELQAIFINKANVIGGAGIVTIINNANIQAIPALQNWALLMLILLLSIVSIKQNSCKLFK